MAWELIVFGAALAAVSIGCLLPAGWLPTLPNDKLLHFVAYGALTLLALPMVASWRQWILCLLGLLLAGAAIELLQNLVPGRSFCWRDLAANAAGIAVAAVCALPAMSSILL
ncbi:VanZ family protein [Oxalobacteraceae bacterium OTU3REALA1]|nr:VanZ family protein [Oxalobacteraceae bacterium OTU3REALA1]